MFAPASAVGGPVLTTETSATLPMEVDADPLLLPAFGSADDEVVAGSGALAGGGCAGVTPLSAGVAPGGKGRAVRDAGVVGDAAERAGVDLQDDVGAGAAGQRAEGAGNRRGGARADAADGDHGGVGQGVVEGHAVGRARAKVGDGEGNRGVLPV